LACALQSFGRQALTKELTMIRPTSFLLAIPLVAVLAPSTANASLERCGGVFLSGDAQCEFRREQDCQEHCEVVSVEQSCAAELYTSCESGCVAEATTVCTTNCAPVCVEECTVTPAQSSADICRTDCLADCDAKCENARNPECCRHACPHTCRKQCENRCNEDDQTIECAPKCVTACDGTCASTAQTTCQVECQTNQWESCQTVVREQCRTDCTDKGGAIFCDGQFLKVEDLDGCAADLSAQLSINLDVNVDATIDTHIDTDGDGDTETCSLGAPAAPKSGALWVAVAVAGAALIRRRRANAG
jgi:MYXO-CTERM domain-containing protein